MDASVLQELGGHAGVVTKELGATDVRTALSATDRVEAHLNAFVSSASRTTTRTSYRVATVTARCRFDGHFAAPSATPPFFLYMSFRLY